MFNRKRLEFSVENHDFVLRHKVFQNGTHCDIMTKTVKISVLVTSIFSGAIQ
jgi:hypothetical protein